MIHWLRPHSWRLILLPLFIYTLTALFITWPLVTRMSTHLAGPGYTDSYEFVRLGWWAQYALIHGLNPFYQSLLGYPAGFMDATQIAQPLIYWPITLLSFFVGNVAAYNLWLLIEVILNGLTAFALCWDVLSTLSTQSTESMPANPEWRWLAALIGGLIFMIFPTVQGHLTAGHINLLSNYALPIVVLCLHRIITGRGGWRIALVGAMSLLVMVLGSFTSLIFALLPLLLFGGVYLLVARRREVWRWLVLRDLVVILVGGAILSLPFYLPLLRDLATANRPTYLQEGGWVTYSADLLGFVSPSPFAAWLKPVVPDYTRAVLGTNSTEGSAYLGLVAVLLAVIALRTRRDARLWLVIALGCMLFSLGPILKVGDQPVRYRLGNQAAGQIESYIVLPYALIQNLPVISVTRTPGRFNFLTGLALGVMAAMGFSTLLAWAAQHVNGRRWWLRGGMLGLCVLIALEYQLFFPFPTTEASLPTYFQTLAARNDDRAVFDVPIDDPLAQKQALWQQTVHHKPLLAGYVTRRTSVDPAKLELLSKLTIGDLNDKSTMVTPMQARSILAEQGIGVVIYHRDLLDAQWDQVLAWANQVFGAAVYQADRMAIYEVPPENAVDANQITLITPSAEFYTTAPDAAVWLREAGDIYLYTSTDVDQRVTVTLSPLFKSRRLQLFVDNALSRAWLIDTPDEPLAFWVKLAPGFHTLRLVTPDGCVEVPVAPMCLLNGTKAPDQCEQLESPICVSMDLSDLHIEAETAMAYQPMTVQLGNGVSLRSVRSPSTAQPGQRIAVDTEWLATEQLPGDYHLFVHLLDSNGTLITQYDNVPGDATFPTKQWSVPQHWAQTAVLDLPATLATGRHEIYAGWYRYPELTRLTVEGNGKGAASQLVFIGYLVIP